MKIAYFYGEQEKELLGRYFRYFRMQSGLTWRDVLDGTFTCANATFQDIEAGIAKSNEDLYDNLLRRYGLRYERNTWERINEYSNQLYEACENLNTRQIEEICAMVSGHSEWMQYAIEREFYMIVGYICKFYVHDEYLSEEEIETCLSLVTVINDKIDVLLIEMVATCNTSVYLSEGYQKILSKYFEVYCDNPIVAQYRAIELYNQGKKKLSVDVLEHLVENWKNNQERRIRAETALFANYREFDTSYAKVMAERLISEVSPDISFKLRNTIRFNVGIFYYIVEDYQKGYECFLANVREWNDIRKAIKSVFFLCACSSLGNIPCASVFNGLDDLKDHHLYLYIKYFDYKDKGENSDTLEQFIVNVLAKKISEEEYDEPMWSVFHHELFYLVQQTKHRKLLDKYELMKYQKKGDK